MTDSKKTAVLIGLSSNFFAIFLRDGSAISILVSLNIIGNVFMKFYNAFESIHKCFYVPHLW